MVITWWLYHQSTTHATTQRIIIIGLIFLYILDDDDGDYDEPPRMQPIIIIGLIFFSFLRSLFRRLHLVDVVLHKNIAKSITKPGSTLMNFDGTGTSVFFEKIWFLLKYFFCMYRSLNKKYEVHVYHLKYEKQTITTMIMIIWLSSPQDKCRKKILKSILKNPNGLHISYFRTIEQTWQTKGLFHMCKILVIISKK